MRYIFACDESGAKGYADQQEQYPGQVGVFAGILVSEVDLPPIAAEFLEAIAPYRKNDGKLHITDLIPSDQQALRQGIYHVITARQLPCFWYAIHVEGYHSNHRSMEELLHNAVTDFQSKSRHIKNGSNLSRPESLHAELFIGLYANIIAFIEERAPGKVDIEVRTDRVDSPIAKLFQRKADHLLDDSPRTTTVKAFDSLKKEVVSRDLHFVTHLPKELDIRTEVVSLKVKTVSDSDPLVVAADILANSLNHLFKNRSDEERYHDLNRPSAVSAHPLTESLDTFWDWGGPDLIGDRLYRHSMAPPPVD